MDLEAIKRKVAKAHGITVAEMVGKCRKKHLVAARSEAIKRMTIAGASLNQIGRVLGNRDHKTIHHHKIKSGVALGENFGNVIGAALLT